MVEVQIGFGQAKTLQSFLDQPTAYVTSQACKKCVEAGFRTKCSPEDAETFREAMHQEASSWLSTEAVRALSKTGVDPARRLRCRCVLT